MTTSSGRAQSHLATTETVEENLRNMLEVRTKTPISMDDDLRESGISSLFVMELVTYMESTYDIVIAGPDLMMENFRTVRTMAAVVHRLRDSSPGGPGER